jgi:hypothetical protein
MQIPARFQGRRFVQMLVRVVVAASCMQMLADCARRPVAPDSAATVASIGANTPNPPPRRAPPQSQSKSDCPFKMSGLGDTWLDADYATPRSCVTSGATRNHPASSTK